MYVWEKVGDITILDEGLERIDNLPNQREAHPAQ